MMYKTIALPLLLFLSILFCTFSVAMWSNILGEKHTQLKLYTGFFLLVILENMILTMILLLFYNAFSQFYFVFLTAEVQANFQSY